VRRAPEFWWRSRTSASARLLFPLGSLIGAVAARRMARPGMRAEVPLICVGNFVVGGAGKTPTALALAEMLIATDERPFFLSRGYGGTRRPEPIVVDQDRARAADVGDEPLLLAKVAPTIVGADRIAAARLAVSRGATAIVMDDGLQSRSLELDLALAVVDGETGVGNGLTLPAGPLRAPLAAQMPYVSAVVVIGPGAAGEAVAWAARRASTPVLRATLMPDIDAICRLQGRRVLAFAGIGRPQKFFATLERAGVTVEERIAFPDHHRFVPKDIADLVRRARVRSLALVTTEKDAVRLPQGSDAVALPVRLTFEEPDKMRGLVEATLARARARLKAGS